MAPSVPSRIFRQLFDALSGAAQEKNFRDLLEPLLKEGQGQTAQRKK